MTTKPPPTSDGVRAAPEPLPPDPEAYDSPRAAAARARGLSAPYIAGGRDPDPVAGSREERFYLRLLLAMVAVIVLGGFVLGIIATILNITGLT
ncbi:MAG: hypothetical protein M3067_13155 [Chloroflexota bacterium]|nr:hypothetical protein [Chloroflexota bacterium]